MSLIFYYAPMSTAVTVHWSLEELGIPYEKVKLSLKEGDTRKPEFLALNPNGKVPVIVHDGVAIFESAAIQGYLGETFGAAKKLFPEAGPKRGVAFSWLAWANVTLGGAHLAYQLNTVDSIPADRRNAKAGEVALEELHKNLAIADAALEGKEWFLGDTFSLVDVHLASFIGYVGMCGVDTRRYGRLSAWLTKCQARPAFKVSMTP